MIALSYGFILAHHAQAEYAGNASDEGKDGVHNHGPDVLLFYTHFLEI